MMNKNILYKSGMLLAGLLLTACSNGNWEDNLRDTIDQGGNNGKTSVYFAMITISSSSWLHGVVVTATTKTVRLGMR